MKDNIVEIRLKVNLKKETCEVDLRGDTIDLLAGLCTLINAFAESANLSEEEVLETIAGSMLDTEEDDE